MPKGGAAKFGKRMMDVKDDIKPDMAGIQKAGVKRPTMKRSAASTKKSSRGKRSMKRA